MTRHEKCCLHHKIFSGTSPDLMWPRRVPRPALHLAQTSTTARCPRKTTHTVSVSLMMIPPKCFLSRFLSPTRDEPTHPRANMQPLMHSPPLFWDGSSVEVALSNCTERVRAHSAIALAASSAVLGAHWHSFGVFLTRSWTRVCARELAKQRRGGCLPLQ